MSTELDFPDGLTPVDILAVIPSELQASIKEARDRWPEFVEALNESCVMDSFRVNAAMHVESGMACRWIDVEVLDHDVVEGSVLSHVRGRNTGYPIQVSIKNIIDWKYRSGGVTVGPFCE